MAWYTESGEMLDDVISTRVRFARNLSEYPFPARLDEKGRVYSTQWSSIYDLTNPSLSLCADMDYENVHIYEVK